MAARTSAHLRPRIVVVDDEPSIRLVWGAILERAGFETTLCHDAEQAIPAIRQGCECVLTDYHMPGMNGIELIEATKQGTYPKFVLITANPSAQVRQDAVAAGASHVLQKPTDPSLVLSTILHLCRRSSSGATAITAIKKFA
jgi:two-component system chemotaxis response regulator CheY